MNRQTDANVSNVAEHNDDLNVRTVFISDIHLGTKGCQADVLLDFLKHSHAQTYYLVGDIVDGWRLKRSWYWPRAHNDVVQKILRKSRKGSNVIYVPGNHDEFLREYYDLAFGDIQIKENPVHITADGKKLLILHGDQYDSVVLYSKWLAFLGDYAYEMLLRLNRPIHKIRNFFGLPHWSLSAYIKHKVKRSVNYISCFEDVVALDAKEKNVDGVVCGHIHHAEIRDINGLTYCNDGDWVESCSALVEHWDGRLEIIHWLDRYNQRKNRQTTERLV